jgi:hypothetical protein
MLRSVVYLAAGLALCGCVINDNSTRNAQIVAVAATAPPPSPHVILTPTARLANAREIVLNKTTTAGATLRLASPQALAPDCSPLGPVSAKVVTPPQNGTISIRPGTAFSNFVPGDPPYACNAQRTPATIITYRSSPAFVGEDRAAVQIFFPDGHAPIVLFHIAVE